MRCFGSRKGERHVIARPLLPSSVRGAESTGACPEGGAPVNDGLCPEGERTLRGAGERRRADFRGGRACARAAPAALDIPPVPLPRDHGGSPLWPAGLTGSITHCQGYRAAIAAGTADFSALGIDAEAHRALPRGVLDRIVSGPAERERLRELGAARPGAHWKTVLFSAKEALYKTWWPLTREPLDFDGMTVFPTSGTAGDSGSFTASPWPPGPGSPPLHGRWLIRKEMILTALALSARYDLNPQFTPPARF
ncbi:4'-phosphopantetheinyl transferase superfamily protein [Streptomyces sp. NBC_01795]|uniref:4'-phosphopantetheinyl transferase family protein n=1 Tax=unclassified Streptomyces TaxID=2593676 RepID=UPI002DDC692B|nr:MULTISPECIES: 4'-phosphopantetheinyl transferase superfamily protein [unclassified Streptomyces]WSA95886.1 4'-phosphopantetheinyl transferase superfamily protein [Streptomyces sp. NBC_01795]WSB80302.1 4'-phosphopantetheinyl transferase superfamily protein [Streptomyces sp. NBC_01775]WSS11488.1 4'-phosphopantetheinyl transferase superfamily protein [Streptomyces sp. NBC_01186]